MTVQPARWVLAVLACAALSADPPLRVGTKPNVAPYEYLDGRGAPTGFCVEVLQAVAEQQGLRLEFQSLNNAEVWEAFQQGRIDVISAAIYTEARAQEMDFTVPLAPIPYVLLVRRGTPGIRSERDLQGREVLVVQRSHMETYATGRGLRVEGLASYEDLLAALAGGRGQAALVPKFTWLHLSAGGRLGQLEAVPAEIYPHRVCLAVPKGRSELLARLNEGIFALKTSGRLDAIYDRHLGSLERAQLPLAKALRRSAAWLVPILLGVGFAVHLGWTFALRRLVKRRTRDLQEELARRTEAEAQLARTIDQLRQALAEVKQLSGLLPICAGCKKIRDDGGAWQPLEGYITTHSEAQFSHGLCPDCVRRLYPEFVPPGGPAAG